MQKDAFFNGLISGVFTTLLFHPIDVLKTRAQAEEGKFSFRASLRSRCCSIMNDSGWRGFYFGLLPSLFGSAISWGLYFKFYETMKQYLRIEELNDFKKKSFYYFSSSTMAGFCTVLITNPVWLIKIRLELESKSNRYYKSSTDAVVKIWQQEGFWGFYKGLTPALVLCLNGGIQFMLYESLKHFIDPEISKTSKFGSLFIIGILAKGTASIITYPYQVVKTRIQQRQKYQKYKSTYQTMNIIIKAEGWRALYKGLLPNLLRVAPNSAVTLMIYEILKSSY